jgi:low affinity Fe/Cu permease
LTQEASFTKEELAQYDGYWDQVSIEKTIKSDARAEGEAARSSQVALEMLKENEPDAKIIKYAKISSAELAELKTLLLQCELRAKPIL